MRRIAICVVVSVFWIGGAKADDIINVPCGPVSDLKDAGKYERLSHDQLIAAKAMFFFTLGSPDQLPPGDSALILKHEDSSASLVFIDGDEACAPTELKKLGMELLSQIKAGIVTHVKGRM